MRSSSLPARCSLVGLLLCGGLGGAGCTSDEAPFDACMALDQAPASPAATVDGGVIYEVYVRSFQDSDGDGVGDLAGLRGRLDYLEWLGVRTAWLMPVHPSPGPAGYDVEDFATVRDDYGDDAELDALVEEAAARGIRVVLDEPINHTARSHPWFQAALAGDDAGSRARYLFSHRQWDEHRWHAGGEDAWYYGYFGQDFPDLDWTDADVVHDMADMMGGWLDRGVGGFRLDAVRQLVEDDGTISDTEAGHCTLGWLLAELSQDTDPLLIAEAWSEGLELTADYLGTPERPQADLVTSVARLTNIDLAFQRGDRRVLTELLLREAELGVEHRMASVIGTHDLSRFRSRVPDPSMRRAWMVLHLTLPGSPVLYYGEEIDLRDSVESTGQDQPWRAPMAWNAEAWGGFTTGTPWMEPAEEYTQGVNVIDAWDQPDSMLRLVRALIDLRRATPALTDAPLQLIDVEAPSVLAFERVLDQDAVLVVVNLDDQDLRGQDMPRFTERAWFDLGTGLEVRNAQLDLPAYGYRVLASEGLAHLEVPGPLWSEPDP